MAFKKFVLDEHTEVTIYKRRASRSVRLTVAANGSVKVSIPTWAPYQAGLHFAKSRLSWIAQQQRPGRVLAQGERVGKAHHLEFEPSEIPSPRSSLRKSSIIVRYPIGMDATSSEVQAVAIAASERALRSQAEQLLPKRLSDLASQNNFEYRDVSIKKLKSRWGSCDQHRNIVLNLYLMDLPWELIDYVLLHELTHTEVLRHGPDFWRKLESVSPEAKQHRKALRNYQPFLNSIT